MLVTDEDNVLHSLLNPTLTSDVPNVEGSVPQV